MNAEVFMGLGRTAVLACDRNSFSISFLWVVVASYVSLSSACSKKKLIPKSLRIETMSSRVDGWMLPTSTVCCKIFSVIGLLTLKWKFPTFSAWCEDLSTLYFSAVISQALEVYYGSHANCRWKYQYCQN